MGLPRQILHARLLVESVIVSLLSACIRVKDLIKSLCLLFLQTEDLLCLVLRLTIVRGLADVVLEDVVSSERLLPLLFDHLLVMS